MVTQSVLTPLQLSPGEIRFYQEEGYLYLPGLLDESAVAALREEVLDVMERTADLSRERLQRARNS